MLCLDFFPHQKREGRSWGITSLQSVLESFSANGVAQSIFKKRRHMNEFWMLTTSNVKGHQEISVKTINFTIIGIIVPCSEITPMQAGELIISLQHEKNSQILKTRSHLAFLKISIPSFNCSYRVPALNILNIITSWNILQGVAVPGSADGECTSAKPAESRLASVPCRRIHTAHSWTQHLEGYTQHTAGHST